MVRRPRLSWEQVAATLECAGAPAALRLDGSPSMQLLVDPDVPRLGVVLPNGDGELDPSPLQHVQFRSRQLDGELVLEVSTKAVELFPYFHGFVITLADRVQLDGWDSHEAVNECIARWHDLLLPAPGLSREAQVGLIGELVVLSSLVAVHGDRGLACWTGPTGEAHDFRLGGVEVEVKTTTGEHRRHVISSDTQLQASPGRDLYLMSVQIARGGGGAGSSLAGWIDHVRSAFKSANARRSFDALLANVPGMDLAELERYREPFVLRSEPYLVPVAENFPRIVLGDLAPRVDIGRLSDVRYRVDVSGLGFDNSDPRFAEVIGTDQ